MGELYTRGQYKVGGPGIIHGMQSKGVSSVRMQIVGGAGTDVIQLKGSLDGVTFFDIEDGTLTGNTTAPLFQVLGYEQITIECTTYGGTPFVLHALYGDLASASQLAEPISTELTQDVVDALTEETVLTERYAHTANNDVEYYGLAPPGTAEGAAEWRIRKFTYDANFNVTSVQYADGDSNFDNVWSDYAILSYS